MTQKTDVKSLTLSELKKELESRGEKAFRARQMYEWMHVKLVRNFDEMTNLSKNFREKCKEWYSYTALTPVKIQESCSGDKPRWRWHNPWRSGKSHFSARYRWKLPQGCPS